MEMKLVSIDHRLFISFNRFFSLILGIENLQFTKELRDQMNDMSAFIIMV